MFGLDMVLINKVFYTGIAYCAAYLAIPAFFAEKTKSATSGISKDLGKLKGTDGFILGRGKNGVKKIQISYKYSKEGVCCIAPTGEGKTTALVEPQLLSDNFPKSSMVIHDTKGELYEHTAEYQRSIGRIPMQFEPLGEGKIKYNPLDFCENDTEIKQIANDILTNGSLATRLASGSGGMSGSDATWINMSVPLLTAALIHFKSLGIPYNNIPVAVRFLINTDAEVIEKTFGESSIDAVRENYNVFSMSIIKDKDGNVSDGGPLTSILTTLATNLTLFLNTDLEKNICSSDFTPKMLREKPIALYVKYDPMKANYLSPFIAVFYSQLLSKLMAYHTANTIPVEFILDEFQNLGKISNMVQVVSLCRYVDIPIMVFVQSLSRLYQIYGRDETASILNNLKTKCILPSLSDVDTMRYISELCGFTELQIQENNRVNKVKKKLFEYDEVRRIEDETCVIVAHNLKPLICKQYRYYDDGEMLLNRYM